MARAPGGLCTTHCQLFNDEITRTENTLRMKWFIKNRQLLLDNLKDEKLANSAKKVRKEFEEERQKKKQKNSGNGEKTLPAWRLPKADSCVNLDVMKPVDSSVRDFLYEKGVESFMTGNNYLHARYKDKPEDRYYYPDCTNWLYGWRLTDHHSPMPATTVGRSSIIQQTFYRRNASSLQRDPDFQGQCQTTNSKNFNEILTY